VAVLNRNHIVTVVIENPGKPIDELKELAGQLYVAMDATTNEAIIAAGVRQARALITTLPSDADNVFVTLTASELNPDILIVSRATLHTSISKLKKAGAANVIMPYKIGGAHMASLVVNPDVKEFIDLVAGHTGFNAHIEEIDLAPSAPNLIGKTLAEINLHGKSGVNIIGLKTMDGYIINPEDSSIYEPGHKFLVIGTATQFSRLKDLLKKKA
jgi:voltage-gated potassium channel